jgi:tetratricopeptide (TPR) repeat protein
MSHHADGGLISLSIRQQKNERMTSASATDQMLSAFKAALVRGSRRNVNASAARLLEARPALGAQWRSVANVLMHNGEITMALAAFRHFVDAAGNSPAARLENGVLHARAGRLVEASHILGAITGSSDPIGLNFARATVALDLGDFVQATELLEDVVIRRPSAGTAWLSLATIGALAAPDRRRALFDAAAHVSSSGVTEKVAWQYAVGRVFAEQGDVDKAFDAFAEGAKLRRNVLPYDHAADRENARHAAEDMVQGGAVPTDVGMVPILVAGLPRSGTTLVEQILASHSAVVEARLTSYAWSPRTAARWPRSRRPIAPVR